MLQYCLLRNHTLTRLYQHHGIHSVLKLIVTLRWRFRRVTKTANVLSRACHLMIMMVTIMIMITNDSHVKANKDLSAEKTRIWHGSIVRCKRLFSMKPAWITSVTVHCGAICRMNIKRQVANLESWGAFDSLQPVFNTLVRGEPLNSGLRNLATRN